VKEPYITHKRALYSPKRDLLMHLLRSGMRKGPESSVTEHYFTPEIDLLTLAPSAPLATGKREGAADYETFRLKLFRYGKV
jgi:hypothetical protein